MRCISALFVIWTVWPAPHALAQAGQASGLSGAELYQAACASCHAADGSGTDPRTDAFAVPPPDFTDCSFASREPDADWLAVMHQGGPVRAFSDTMPAFGDALAVEDLQRTLAYVRAFCADDAWPRGELNLPRPLFTEKAYPEDEAVLTIDGATEGPGSVRSKVVYERRFGARNQLEVVVPYALQEGGVGGWRSGVGDLAVGIKRALVHNLRRGSIFSVAGELVLPTGDDDEGFGRGVAMIEPFVAFGQVLPSEGFFQFQSGIELPVDSDRVGQEAFWRLAVGRTFVAGGWGRSWTPMVELLAARELEAGETTSWDLVPQMQVSLATRQHILANVGVRLPVTDARRRATSIVVYLLWDWFDGGFFDGW